MMSSGMRRGERKGAECAKIYLAAVMKIFEVLCVLRVKSRFPGFRKLS